MLKVAYKVSPPSFYDQAIWYEWLACEKTLAQSKLVSMTASKDLNLGQFNTLTSVPHCLFLDSYNRNLSNFNNYFELCDSRTGY